MKTLLLSVLFFGCLSCSSFSEIARETKVGSEDDHVKVYNLNANVKSLTFGDFKFATNPKQFRKISTTRPRFRNILFYAKTSDPAYDYYVLYNPCKSPSNDEYILKDTLMGESNFVLAISKTAPKPDIKYIMSHLALEK